jgi:hypothetical protein
VCVPVTTISLPVDAVLGEAVSAGGGAEDASCATTGMGASAATATLAMRYERIA